jgi:hypothetical protein
MQASPSNGSLPALQHLDNIMQAGDMAPWGSGPDNGKMTQVGQRAVREPLEGDAGGRTGSGGDRMTRGGASDAGG